MDTSMLPFGKGPPCKQKKARNNKRPTDQDRCAICGKPYASLHEIYYGTGQRQQSIKWKMQIRLCQLHHTGQGEIVNGQKVYGVHYNPEMDLELKQRFERQFIALYGFKQFMKVFNVNYLEVSEVDISNRSGPDRIGICTTGRKAKAG